jgi:hypothetical protein
MGEGLGLTGQKPRPRRRGQSRPLEALPGTPRRFRQPLRGRLSIQLKRLRASLMSRRVISGSGSGGHRMGHAWASRSGSLSSMSTSTEIGALAIAVEAFVAGETRRGRGVMVPMAIHANQKPPRHVPSSLCGRRIFTNDRLRKSAGHELHGFDCLARPV